MNIEESIIEFKKMIERDKGTLRYWKSDTFGHYDEPIKKLEKDVLISETLLTAYEKEKEKNRPQPDCAEPVERTEEMVNMKWVNYRYINKEKLKEILGIEENLSEERILSLLETIVSENSRLEDIEDRKVQVDYERVFNKGVKSVEDKIKAKIEEEDKLKELQEIDNIDLIHFKIKELLEED